MPRKSVAEMNTPNVVSRLKDYRPPPPDDLSPEAAREWREVVAKMPGDWAGRGMQSALSLFCQHACTARKLTALIDSFDETWLAEAGGIERFDHLLRLRDRESRSVASLGVKLRLLPSSQYGPRAAATLATKSPDGPPPWQPIP